MQEIRDYYRSVIDKPVAAETIPPANDEEGIRLRGVKALWKVMVFTYLNVIPSALIAVDCTLNVTFINQAAEMLFGVSMQQAKSRPLSTMPAFDETLCAFCTRVFDSCEEISLFEQLLRLPLNHRTVTMHIPPSSATCRMTKS